MANYKLDVRSKLVPLMMITGPYNATPFSSSVVTITDKTERPLPRVNTGSYSVFSPIVSPKGITNEIVYFTGNDVLNKYNKMFGKPNTVLYGTGATYAWEAVRGGFNLGVINVRPIDATYPNFFVNFNIEKNEDEKMKQKLFVRKHDEYTGDAADKINELRKGKKFGYHFALVNAMADEEAIKKAKAKVGYKEDGNPEEDDQIQEIELDTYDFGFKYFNIKGMTSGYGLQVFGKNGINIDTNFGEILNTDAAYPKKLGDKYANKDNETTKQTDEGTVDLTATDSEMVSTSEDRRELHPLTPGLRVPFNLEAKRIVSLPIFGLVYRGAGDYGNIFTAEFSTKSSPLPIDRSYPYFKCVIREVAHKEEHSFDFTLFGIGQDGFNYNFEDRANKACRIQMNETNHNNTFTPYLVSRKESIKIEKGLTLFFDQLRADILKKLGEQFPTDAEKFEKILTGDSELDSDSIANVQNVLLGEINVLEEDFKRNTSDPKKRTIETPFSRIAPWELNPVDFRTKRYRRKAVPFLNLIDLPRVLKFDGGANGCLTPILGEEEFDWNATVENPYASTVEELKAEDDAKKRGELGTYQVYLDLFKKAYTGELDPAIFDATVIPDSIVFGDGYPFELQEVVADMCRYKEDIVHLERTRPDWTYFRTPEEEVDTEEAAIEWSQRILNANKSKNTNMKPVVGSWMFTDPTTGGSVRLSGLFDYLGRDSSLFNWLLSGTADSFASGDHSVVFRGADGTQQCIPRTSEQKADLCRADVMYYRRRRSGLYGLGEDTGYNPGMLSSMKTIGTIHFNRILCEAHLYMLDNTISNTDKDTLERHRKGIEKAIAPFTRHYKNRVTVEMKISDHPNEQDEKVILAEIKLVGHEYSRHNRINQIMTSENFK